MKLTEKTLAQMIDHTELKPNCTQRRLEQLCREAIEYGFWSVCINPVNIPPAVRLLEGSSVKVCSVVGFPLGATFTETKVFETQRAVSLGADEIDMVINIGGLLDGQLSVVKSDIEGVVRAASGRPVKVILETGFLTDEQKRQACLLSKEAGAKFVKTSTGFGPSGADPSDVRLMRDVVGSSMGVKAAGGIRNFSDALRMIQAGASRIGSSAGVAIIEDFRQSRQNESNS